MAGLPQDKALDGVNLIPYLSGNNDQSPHKYLYWRFWNQTAVRDDRWKLINAGNKGSYLFDLKNDPEEKVNLIHKEPELAKQLKMHLENWAKELMPPGIPDKTLRVPEVKWYNYYFKN
ncbi:MAG TPA: sulfatase/phosphatase domain-containing protein, partial [Chitinophagaceae bacterium]|nr:sulfatase/phosphatase domain-containing protein [Chitinophagaceae bacterium]